MSLAGSGQMSTSALGGGEGAGLAISFTGGTGAYLRELGERFSRREYCE